jgi:hypothetical protein
MAGVRGPPRRGLIEPYITAKVSYTVMLAPPWSTGQLLAYVVRDSCARPAYVTHGWTSPQAISVNGSSSTSCQSV